MDDKWDGVFTEDDLPELFKNVEQAKRLGQERFGNVLMEAADLALQESALPYLLTGLVIGNIAFGASPECSIALTDKHRVHIQIVEEA